MGVGYSPIIGEIMGIFGIKKVPCPKGVWTTLIRNFASGMPADWEITFKPKNGGRVSGHFIEKRAWWILPQDPVQGRLKRKMAFHRNWINAVYSLRVCPDQDLLAEID